MSKESPVMQLLSLVWKNCNTATSHSWERVNHSMQNALSLAIGSGFAFRIEDMKTIASSFRFGYWSSDPEWIYSLAVNVSNLSAAKSYEAWKEREPFIADGVAQSGHNTGFTHGVAGSRQCDRLATGSVFNWKGYKVTVTSFSKGGAGHSDCSHGETAVNVCAYKKVPGSVCGNWEYTNKVERRFRITREDLIADRAGRKERGLILLALTAANNNTKLSKILKKIGVVTKEDYERVDIQKLRDLVSKLNLTIPKSKKEKPNANL